MKTYRQITAEIEELQRQAEEARKNEVEGVVARIKEAIAQYQLTAADLGLASKRGPATTAGKTKAGKGRKARPSRSKSSLKPKYGDGTGNTWVGRGKRPVWLQTALVSGKKLEDFLLK